jgi:hypothetical protein
MAWKTNIRIVEELKVSSVLQSAQKSYLSPLSLLSSGYRGLCEGDRLGLKLTSHLNLL